MPQSYRIATIPGDGIGREVVPEGMRVLEAVGRRFDLAFQFDEVDWSCDHYKQHGRMMPEDGLERFRGHDAIFLGAVGWPDVPDHVSLWGLLIPIRRTFHQYVNLRPVRLLRGTTSPLAGRGPEDIDFYVVRENVEGEYSEVGGRLYRGTADELAVQEAVFTRRGVDRILRYAFELARTRERPPRHLGHQVQRHRPHHALLGRALRGREAGLPRRRDRAVPHRHPLRALRAAPGLVRRGGGLQPLRRHPVGPRARGRGLHRHRALGQHQPRARAPFDVRARPRLRARHRGPGNRQPHRPDLVGGHDARPSGPGGGRRGRDRRDRGR